MADLLILEAANLFVVDDPSFSEHLAITHVKLPTQEREFYEHTPGGSYRSMDIPLCYLNKCEVFFGLVGWQPYITQLLTLQRPWLAPNVYTIYGLLRPKMRPEEPLRVRAVVEGYIGIAEPTDFRRGGVQTHEYAIKGITHYTIDVEDEIIQDWDFWNNTLESAEQRIAV